MHSAHFAGRHARAVCTALCAATALYCGPAVAEVAPGADAQSHPLEDVLVTGQQPGPGLWRVSDGEHELWILGTLDPLPKHLDWRSPQVEALVAKADGVIAPPQATFSIGMVSGLLLLPAWLHARHNPDNKTLRDVLPADVYAHWTVLRSRYAASDDGLERLRPVVAVHQLYERALRRSDLSEDGLVWSKVRTLARAHRVPVTSVDIAASVEDPRSSLKQWSALAPASEAECFATTLDRLERDVSLMRERASLWSVGDVDALRRVVDVDPDAACREVLARVASLREPVVRLRKQLEAAWRAAVEKALTTQRSTIAVLPIAKLLGADGVVQRLRDSGYTVTEP